MKFSIKLIGLGTLTLLSSQVNAFSDVGGYMQWNYASVSGFQQTPKGGNPGTTSFERPSFGELKLDSKSFLNLGIWGTYNTYRISFDYLPLKFKGQSLLSSALVTHKISFPIGADFNMKVNDHLYSLTFSKTFHNNPLWGMTPGLKLYCLDHDYSFQSNGVASKRAFWAAGLGVGLETYYLLSNRIELNVKASATLPITNLEIYQAAFSVKYHWNLTEKLLLKPYATVSWNKIEFKDNQPVPNYLKYNLNPAWGIGFIMEWS